MSSIEVRLQLRLRFQSGEKFELGIGILESCRVPFLTWRLILLIGLIPLAVESFAGYFILVEISAAAAIGFTVNGIDT